MRNKLKLLAMMLVVVSFVFAVFAGAEDTGKRWKMDKPITSFWGWPSTTPEMAQLMVDGGCNYILNGGGKEELDTAYAKGLRVIIGGHYPGSTGLHYLLDSSDKEQLAAIDALVTWFNNHPAIHGYFIMDEPEISVGAAAPHGPDVFIKLRRLIDNFRSRDPGKLFLVNLSGLWDYKSDTSNDSNIQNKAWFADYLNKCTTQMKPDILCYDEYPFWANGTDEELYFLSLAMVRQSALAAGIPFMIIHQACDWGGSTRVPNADEMRWQDYTSLAYGFQGLSYFALSGFSGCMIDSKGNTTPGYAAARELNPQFIAIASQLLAIRSLHAYHLAGANGMPWGGDPLEKLPAGAPFYLNFSAPGMSKIPAEGMLLGYFGKADKPTHVLVVNLNYKRAVTTTVMGPSPLSLFDATTGKWTSTKNSSAVITLPPGGGQLIRTNP